MSTAKDNCGSCTEGECGPACHHLRVARPHISHYKGSSLVRGQSSLHDKTFKGHVSPDGESEGSPLAFTTSLKVACTLCL